MNQWNKNQQDNGVLVNHHKVAAEQCIQSIHAGLSTRAEADYKKTRSAQDPPTSVIINFSTLANNRLGFHTLQQKWLNELLALSRDKGVVSFELPENLDGMQVALSFEATYRVFPVSSRFVCRGRNDGRFAATFSIQVSSAAANATLLCRRESSFLEIQWKSVPSWKMILLNTMK